MHIGRQFYIEKCLWPLQISGDRGSAVVNVLCYRSERCWFDPRWCHIKSFRSHYGPGFDSASDRNEYQEYFLGVKSGRCARLTTYHHPVPLSRNLGNLTSWNPLALSTPVMGLLYLYLLKLNVSCMLVSLARHSRVIATPALCTTDTVTEYLKVAR